MATTTTRKLRVGLIFGGRSVEHEISLASATSVMMHLDSNKYEVVPIGITKMGEWLWGVAPTNLLAGALSVSDEAVDEKFKAPCVHDTTSLQPGIPVLDNKLLPADETVDVAFPVMHGTYGEDGTLQGLLEMANVPYVGCGVLGSALGMDKEKMKMIFRSVGLPTVDSLTFRRQHWESSPEMILDAIQTRLGYPCFVKPTNQGSSVGVSKAHSRSDLEQAMHIAAKYDSKTIVERAINCRELECSVLGNCDPVVSAVGEVIMNHEFYDYSAKYLDSSSHTIVPADIPQTIAEEIRCQAVQAFLALDLSGLARVDFFLEKETGQVYINEVNTLPSFTPECMYPKLCEDSGLPYTLLLDHLIELALERHADRQRNQLFL